MKYDLVFEGGGEKDVYSWVPCWNLMHAAF